MVQGEALAIANSEMAIYSGVGIIVGPWIAARFLSDRATFGMAALFAVLNGAMLLLRFRETLPLSERKPVKWAACNPLTFTKCACPTPPPLHSAG